MDLEDIMLSEIIQTEKGIPYDLIYVEFNNKSKLRYRERTGGCQRWGESGVGEDAKWVKGVKSYYKLPVIKKISPGDVMYSIVNIVTNTVLHI